MKFAKIVDFAIFSVVAVRSTVSNDPAGSSFYCRPTIVKGDIAVDFSGRPGVRLSPILVKVFLFANISVSIHWIAFCRPTIVVET